MNTIVVTEEWVNKVLALRTRLLTSGAYGGVAGNVSHKEDELAYCYPDGEVSFSSLQGPYPIGKEIVEAFWIESQIAVNYERGALMCCGLTTITKGGRRNYAIGVTVPDCGTHLRLLNKYLYYSTSLIAEYNYPAVWARVQEKKNSQIYSLMRTVYNTAWSSRLSIILCIDVVPCLRKASDNFQTHDHLWSLLDMMNYKLPGTRYLLPPVKNAQYNHNGNLLGTIQWVVDDRMIHPTLTDMIVVRSNKSEEAVYKPSRSFSNLGIRRWFRQMIKFHKN